MEKIGFIGLGIMGKPMAKNLLKAGYSLTVYDIVPEAVADVVKAGAQKGDSSKDVASKSEIIITMLPNSPEVKEAVLGRDGVLDGAKSGTILIDMSSIAPLASQEVSAKAKEIPAEHECRGIEEEHEQIIARPTLLPKSEGKRSHYARCSSKRRRT